MPVSVSVPLSTGMRWRGGGGWCYEEKIDGVRATLINGQLFGRSRAITFPSVASLNNCQLDGEFAGNVFYAFDVLNLSGQDLRSEPLHFRREVLADLLQRAPCNVRPVRSGQGGEFLEYVLGQGGEGVVAKHLSSIYGESGAWVKCKAFETHDCRVEEIHPSRQTVRLTLNGEPAGWCAILGQAFQHVAVGQCIEVAAHSIHPSGRLREPRFIRFRPDKD